MIADMPASSAQLLLRPNWIGLAFCFVVLVAFLMLFVSPFFSLVGWLSLPAEDEVLLLLFSPLSAFAIFFICLLLLRTTVTVRVDSEAGLCFKTLLGRPQTVLQDRLHGFSAMSSGGGIVVYASGGQHFQLLELCTRSVHSMKSRFEDWRVPFLGFEWVWWPFHRSRYRYDPR